MPAFTIPMHEANDCHLPAGSAKGGEFCSKNASGWVQAAVDFERLLGPDRGVAADRAQASYTVPDTSAHPLVRDRGMWGGSHTGSSYLSGIAAQQMGIQGYPLPYEANAEATRTATKFLSAIAASPGSEEPLYHGFQNVRKTEFREGDTFRIPLTATSGDLGSSAGYGLRLDRADQQGEATVFAFPVGTKLSAYGKHKHADAMDFRHVYAEAIVAGEFRVKSVQRALLNKPQHDSTGPVHQWHPMTEIMVVELEPVSYYDPASQTWRPHG